ncbi:mitochondrial protein import protein Zim17p [[Candida] anglica]
MISRALRTHARNFRPRAVALPSLSIRVPHMAKPMFTMQSTRFNSTNDSSSKPTDQATLKVDPQYMIAFTCKKCDTRSSHTFSKQAYHKGTVLIQCPGCKNRHLIADNLKIFDDKKVNLEDILKAKGESVATGTEDLAFEDIPDSLKKTLGHYAKDAPEEYRKEDDNKVKELPEK